MVGPVWDCSKQINGKCHYPIVIAEKGKELVRSHCNSPDRVKNIAVRLLEIQCEYAPLLANAMMLKAVGKDEEALEYTNTAIASYLGREERYYEKYFDFDLTIRHICTLLKKKVATVQF